MKADISIIAVVLGLVFCAGAITGEYTWLQTIKHRCNTMGGVNSTGYTWTPDGAEYCIYRDGSIIIAKEPKEK